MTQSFADYGIEVSGTGQFKATCPECTPGRKASNQNKKDLSVNTDLGAWHCQHCGWEGRLMNDKKENFIIKREAKKYEKPNYQRGDLPESAISFFSARGISSTTLDHFKIGFNKAQGTILFPVIKAGEVINIKTRTKSKDFTQSKNAEKCVYGYDNISDVETVICEGEMDALAIYDAGYPAICSLPEGALNFKFWENVEDRFQSINRVVIWTDSDKPGYQSRAELAKRIGYERAFYVESPKGCKDANDVLLAHGKDKVLELIANAKEFPIDGIVYGKDIDLLGYWKFGAKEGWSTGIKSLDPYWKFAPEAGELVIATGYPGHGKSDFLMDIVVRQAKEGRKVGIFSPEEFPLPRLMKKLMEKYYGLNAQDLCQDQVEDAGKWLDDNFYFQYLEDSTPDVDMVCAVVKALAIKKGIRFFLLDPWNELNHSIRGRLSETEWVNQALGQLRRVARQYCVTILVVAHPTKPTLGEEDSAPSSWAISGSAGFRNKADVVLSVHRPLYGKQEEDGEVDISITKVKDKDMGGLGRVQLNYRYESGTYNSLL